ncbi:MAG TPA: DNA polymerase III subunit delta' [Corynebacterium sp.]|nr:DNA polymerase III subunit delta' [Corynebacterium sp.]
MNNPVSAAERLADTPTVRDSVLAAAAAARGQGDRRAMTHAWLLTGAPGSGRSIVAQAFAAALVCPAGLGCGVCESCRSVWAGAHTDVVHVVPESLSISVDLVRRIIRQAASLPTIAAWRVVIIEDADRLSPAAADAFLKTVEEPPERTVILLLAPSTDPQDFSQTLRSRCRHLYVPSPSEAEIVRILTSEEGATEEAARLAASASLRHVGRARRLVRNSAVQQRRASVLNIAEAIYHGDQAFQAVSALIRAVDKEAKEDYAEEDAAEREKLELSLGRGGKGKGTARAAHGTAGTIKDLEKKQKTRQTRRKRDSLDLALIDFAGVYRDALMLKTGAQVPLTHPDFAPLAREIAGRSEVAGLVACQDAITTCREHLGQSVSPQIAFDGMIGRIRLALNVT